MAYNSRLRSEHSSPRYLGPREIQSAPPTVTRQKRRMWHNVVEFVFGRRRRSRRRGVQRSTTHPQGFILPPYAFQSMGYPVPPPHIPYMAPYGAPPPAMVYMPPPPPRTHDVNDRSFMDPEFYNLHPEYDLRSEHSHQSGSTRPGSGKNYRRGDQRNQPPFAFSGASPQEIEEYETEPLPLRRRRSLERKPRNLGNLDEDDDVDEEEEETLTSPIKGFDSFMMY